MKIVNVEQMRQIEHDADARGQTYAVMMDMAGRSVAEAAATLMLRESSKQVLILVGPGNNGGDGLVAARYLMESGTGVTVYLWKRDIKGDENFQQLKRRGRRRGLDILWADNDANYAHLREQLQTADLLIDALLGTGASRPIEGKLAEILGVVQEEILARRKVPARPAGPELGRPMAFPLAEALTVGLRLPGPGPEDEEYWNDLDDDLDDGNDEDDDDDDDFLDDDLDDFDDEPIAPRWPALPVLAVDCPTGLNSDTGAIDASTVAAQLTLTFGYPKWGHVQYPGAGASGVLGVADIGLPPDLADDINVELVGPAEVAPLLPERPVDANKGTFGKVMIAAGSLNYTGAATLSASAAGRAGAGLVTLAVPAPLHGAIAAALPEVTWLLLPDHHGTHSAEGVGTLRAGLDSYRALLVGPGLTTQPGARAFVEGLFGADGLPKEAWRGRLVADADCLNILSTLSDWPALLPSETILTPHPGEMGRLTGLKAAEINALRIETARKWSGEWGHIVLLKGAHTVVAAPDGRAAVLPFSTPALATAGSGDVLAGAIVAMLAQGLLPFEAALCGSYIHGQAGMVTQRDIGMAGVVAADIVARLPKAWQQVVQA